MPEAPLVDRREPAAVGASEVVFEGRVWDVRRDRVSLPTGDVVREYVVHPGAVAIVALDDGDRVFLIQQYRHPIGTYEWELPAGLLDVQGEPPVTCAQRELHEEADLVAGRWHHLLTYHSSPGGMNEVLHLFLARDLHPVPAAERHERTDEEAGMPTRWIPLSQLRDHVLAGAVGNAALIIGTLVTVAAHADGFARLGPIEG